VLPANILQYVDPLSAVLILAVYRLLKLQHRELQKDVAEIRNRLRRLEDGHMTEKNKFTTEDD